MTWDDIPGWFQWRSGQEEAVDRFPASSRIVEVGNCLGRSLSSLGEVISGSGVEEARGENCSASVRKIDEGMPEAERWSTNQWRWVLP